MDLINKLGSQKEQAKAQSTGKVETNVPHVQSLVSSDLINQAKGTGTKVEAENTEENQQATLKEVAGKEVETASKENEVVGDPSSWTKDSAFKEVKRLREENKSYRLKYEEKLNSLKDESEKRISAREQELEALKKQAQELEEIKAKQADSKRDLAEKVAHREAEAARLKAEKEAIEKESQRTIAELRGQLDRHQADIEAQKEVYKTRLQTEMSTIPEKFKTVAELIIKGAGDERDALVAISEAKLNGVFEDKTVIVNHSVPGAHDGARATNERLNEARAAERNKMTPSQKIGAALKSIKSGEKNPAFKSNR